MFDADSYMELGRIKYSPYRGIEATKTEKFMVLRHNINHLSMTQHSSIDHVSSHLLLLNSNLPAMMITCSAIRSLQASACN